MTIHGIQIVNDTNFIDKISHIYLSHSLDCYSTIEDIKCREENIGNLFDELYYRGKCQNVQSICESYGFIGVNVNYCLNTTTSLKIPLNEVITRTLSAEEFF